MLILTLVCFQSWTCLCLDILRSRPCLGLGLGSGLTLMNTFNINVKKKSKMKSTLDMSVFLQTLILFWAKIISYVIGKDIRKIFSPKHIKH